MRIYGNLKDCLVMTKKEQPGKKDPTKKYCYLGIVMDNELGEVSCTEDVYAAVEIWNVYDFGFCYNTNFDMFQLEACQRVGIANVPQAAAPEAAPAETTAEKPAEEKAAKAEKAGK